MKIKELETPCLLIDREIMMDNIRRMQLYADKYNVNLRPHTKTHKMPALAKLQEQVGAKGITVAKVGEAEVMAENGLNDIFIANQIVGEGKLSTIKKLAESIDISFGVDSIEQCKMIEKVFSDSQKQAQVLIEIEVGENRSGIIEESDFVLLVDYIKNCSHVNLLGIFSHDGHTYKAKDLDECRILYNDAQIRTLHFARLAEEQGCKLETVSIGSTPPLMHDFGVMEGITELRVGTYILMDVAQGNAIGTYSNCAASVLTTVISKPTKERVITDVGAKGLTMQTRSGGICATTGLGYIKDFDHVYVNQVYDEHAIIYNETFRNTVEIGQKVEIIPNHICPVCNLYDNGYLISGDEVVEDIPILCRGKLQ
ncbi:D-serine deaminase-like pyridoxal phosphate-dependent protein [Bacillus mesophilus]|uniref:D-TA family PLP-dependent enzyme n=1 Tax=Bacillus mesophilus TaxID=1808955 RepID=A0A6M0QE34_9BACI|nr:alanine racemase [Bacillus mesophilus]MBM7662879.1 D-serine deaminase-like pyridoxal phosphate-dependent protein [Bacillus mesophilus]NEY73468.1 D-TA family PLP-dependent enzyme [Bacillus mesophilus]